jgi:hypothetical protein
MGVDPVAFEFVDDPIQAVIIGVQIRIIDLVDIAQAKTFDAFAQAGQQGAAFAAGQILGFVDNDNRIFNVHAPDIG